MPGPLQGARQGMVGVELADGAVPPLAVLLKRLRLHHLATVAAHHQEKVVVRRAVAVD